MDFANFGISLVGLVVAISAFAFAKDINKTARLIVGSIGLMCAVFFGVLGFSSLRRSTSLPAMNSALQPTPTSALSPKLMATSTVGNVGCREWNPAMDVRVYPNQENPNRDSCGNKDVWHFMASTDRNRNPKTYFLLRSFTESNGGTVGQMKWFDPTSRWLGVYFNAIESQQQWPRRSVLVHPEAVKMVVIGWRSPIDGVISVGGGVSDAEADCGDGVNWYVSHDGKELAAGGFSNGGAQEFKNGLGGEGLSRILVKKENIIYIVIDSKGENRCDSTYIELTISQE